MLAATGRAGHLDLSTALERARPRLIARRLPVFAAGWLLTTVIWGMVLVLDARLAVFPATLLFIFQLGVLITAIAICHHGARPARIPVVALAACVLLSLSSTSLFAAIGGYGEMLAFILLTLFLASSPLFAWSGRAALILLFGTLVPWLLSIPFLRFFLRPFELCAAIGIGAGVSLLVLEATKRNARLAFRRRRPGVGARVAATSVATPAFADAGKAPSALLPRSDTHPQAGKPAGGEIGTGPASTDDAHIAILRQPLLRLKDEEVDGLRKELRRLKVEVNRRLAEDELATGNDTRTENPPPVRRRRRRAGSQSSSGATK